jgi:hypothetical protein
MYDAAAVVSYVTETGTSKAATIETASTPTYTVETV